MTTNPNKEAKIGRDMSITERRNALEEQFPVWPRNTIAKHFSKVCKQYPDRAFVYIEGESGTQAVTYKEVWENARAYAKSFMHFGVKRREHIAVLMENDAAYPSLMIAASLIGAVFIPINIELQKDELKYILQQSDSKYIFFHETIKNRDIAGIISELWHDTAFREESLLKYYICLSDGYMVPDEHFLDFLDFISKATSIPDSKLDERFRASEYPDETATILYTSGSTGKPKGVMLTHEHLLRCSYSTCMSRAIEDGRITYAPLPFYHCFAMIEGLLAMSFVGGTLVTASRFAPVSALEAMETYRANDFLCVPSMLVSLLNESRVTEYDLSPLFAMWCGAAPAPIHVWKNAVEKLGLMEICTGYGQTEVTSSGVTTEMDDPVERIATRVGRPKIGGAAGLPEFNGSIVEYKTIDPETGTDVKQGAIGELAVRGSTVTHGYYNKPDETARTIDKDGWLRTGDVGRMDEQGYIEVLGRTNDLYKVSGELVAPRETEEVIAEHPAVNQVAIVGVPDKTTGEAGAAFIELKSGEGETYERRDIIDWCANRVARFKIPRHVQFINANDWPLTSTGKIQKNRLGTGSLSRF